MSGQEQAEIWDDIKEIWGNSSKGEKINFQVTKLISELKSKMSEFETNSINSDMTKVKSSWKQYKGKVSQFEKDSVSKDVLMITRFLKKVLRKLKLKK
ncbi:MAG: hypothetical protein HRT58_06155 [Crocinitomicaceae bacterium]|nr:hypothetical protein [Flavobacteriales bacterium]NQZ35226.1 hypothetical protein [Crocinitomicaceae bacterium]